MISELLLKKNEGLWLIIGIYIYKGYFCNFRVSGFYPGQVSGRVSDFFIKPGPALVFFFLKPIPDLIPNRIG